MPVIPVLLLGNPLLRENSDPIEDFNHKVLERTIVNLKDTLLYLQRQEGVGRGLAAPQLGDLKQIIVYNAPGAPEVMINPQIQEMSTEIFCVWDSCFCFKIDFFIEVERFRKIRVKYQDINGVQKVINADNELAELFQHEIDHLHGILAVDRMTSSRNIVMREEWNKRFR